MAPLIAAPASTKNREGKRDLEIHQSKKGNQWYFGMKAHIGVDAATGLVHSLVTTAANVHDVTQAHALLHGEQSTVFADAGYVGAQKREENQDTPVQWQIAMRPGKRKALRGLAKNTAQMFILFWLANLLLAKRHLMPVNGMNPS
jgi:transposase, IS5 family